MLDLPELYSLVGVVDPLAERRADAERMTGCRAYADLGELLADAAPELVVVASPSHLHRAHTETALEAAHVLCEKPMGVDLQQADRMIVAAQSTGRHLSVFHNYRFQPDFVKVRELVASGVLGRLLLVKLREHRYGRRLDWQALAALGGGALRNVGPHLVDQALQLSSIQASGATVVASTACCLSAGDAEDHVKLVVSAAAGPVVDIEISDATPFPEPRWSVVGTHGALSGTAEELRWRHVDPTSAPPATVEPTAAPGRRYDFDVLPTVEHVWPVPATAPRSSVVYYQQLFETLRNDAVPVVTLASARAVMEVLDAAGATQGPARST